ncbi:uncharacterized protein isoform X2 [Rhodnius prolixus]|uniref:uncharacterized protein isoform X2 n=1 Tax=Rhodnius prolixus TaxID=13249 RepID=UPI003D18E687
MTVACLFMLAMMAIAITHGFVCPVNICSQVECSDELTEKTCDGELIPNSSFCGCCTTCVKYIESNGHCNALLQQIIGPGSPSQRCLPDHICVDNRCIPIF